MKTSLFIGSLLLLFTTSITFADSSLTPIDCAKYRALYQCPTDNTKYPVHLTFDDGPADTTLGILSLLQQYKIPATFFAIAEKLDCPSRLSQQAACTKGEESACQAAQQCQERHSILQQIKQAGYQIGSHSYWHVRHSELNAEQRQWSIQASKQILQPYLTTQPPLFRLPHGDGYFNQSKVPEIMQTVEQAGFKHVGWQVSAYDWRKADQQGDKILQNVMQGICQKQGGIVLFHDGDAQYAHKGRYFTAQHLDEWLPIIQCVADFRPISDVL